MRNSTYMTRFRGEKDDVKVLIAASSFLAFLMMQ